MDTVYMVVAKTTPGAVQYEEVDKDTGAALEYGRFKIGKMYFRLRTFKGKPPMMLAVSFEAYSPEEPTSKVKATPTPAPRKAAARTAAPRRTATT